MRVMTLLLCDGGNATTLVLLRVVVCLGPLLSRSRRGCLDYLKPEMAATAVKEVRDGPGAMRWSESRRLTTEVRRRKRFVSNGVPGLLRCR
jgi:hypothetical protein